MIEILNEKQQKFLRKSKVVKKVKKYLDNYHSYGNYPANFWLGAELWRSNWYWTHCGKKVKYVPNIHPLDKKYTQAYAYMSVLSKKSVQWKFDRPQNHYGNQNGGSTQSLMPLCQISTQTRQRSKNLGE